MTIGAGSSANRRRALPLWSAKAAAVTKSVVEKARAAEKAAAACAGACRRGGVSAEARAWRCGRRGRGGAGAAAWVRAWHGVKEKAKSGKTGGNHGD
ncbi:hypothetical protein L3i22_086160 [Actinoplanes sp. L3-i22]|nr:hypothetical protein L3i22_086160 [Actinoplanes sp. L3-i22]